MHFFPVFLSLRIEKMRTPAEHKVFQWICWEKKYGKPVFKIFGTAE